MYLDCKILLAVYYPILVFKVSFCLLCKINKNNTKEKFQNVFKYNRIARLVVLMSR